MSWVLFTDQQLIVFILLECHVTVCYDVYNVRSWTFHGIVGIFYFAITPW